MTKKRACERLAEGRCPGVEPVTRALTSSLLDVLTQIKTKAIVLTWNALVVEATHKIAESVQLLLVTKSVQVQTVREISVDACTAQPQINLFHTAKLTLHCES